MRDTYIGRGFKLSYTAAYCYLRVRDDNQFEFRTVITWDLKTDFRNIFGNYVNQKSSHASAGLTRM